MCKDQVFEVNGLLCPAARVDSHSGRESYSVANCTLDGELIAFQPNVGCLWGLGIY